MICKVGKPLSNVKSSENSYAGGYAVGCPSQEPFVQVSMASRAEHVQVVGTCTCSHPLMQWYYSLPKLN